MVCGTLRQVRRIERKGFFGLLDPVPPLAASRAGARTTQSGSCLAHSFQLSLRRARARGLRADDERSTSGYERSTEPDRSPKPRKKPGPGLELHALSNRSIVTLKVLVHAVCLAPLAWLAWGLFHTTLGPDPTHTVTYWTGRGTLRILILSLGITPVRKLLPRLSWLIRFRRVLGLYAFFYASLHLLTYLGLYAGFSWAAIADDLAKRPYIWAGFTSWTLLVPLALTSTAWSIRALGGKRWQWLHRLVYVSAIAGVTHYWWIVKTGVRSPMPITLVLAVLLLARPALAALKGRRKAMPPARAAAG